MPPYDDLIEQLVARLPELEWKLEALGPYIIPKLLPKGLFQDSIDITPQRCIEEIKADLQGLKNQTNMQVFAYTAQRVTQKVNVLVHLCRSLKAPPKRKSKDVFQMKAISTRQQWLQSVQEEIARLETQRAALGLRLAEMTARQDKEVVLSLQAELGELEQRLTLLVEANVSL